MPATALPSDNLCLFSARPGPALPCRWSIQTLGGVFCLLMGLTSKSLGATMAILVIFSIFCQQSCGLSFGVVPFVSKRSTGLVSGFVGSGGNVGGAVTQVIRHTCRTHDTAAGQRDMCSGAAAVASTHCGHATSLSLSLSPLPPFLLVMLTLNHCAPSCVLARILNLRPCSSPTPACPPLMASNGWV